MRVSIDADSVELGDSSFARVMEDAYMSKTSGKMWIEIGGVEFSFRVMLEDVKLARRLPGRTDLEFKLLAGIPEERPSPAG